MNILQFYPLQFLHAHLPHQRLTGLMVALKTGVSRYPVGIGSALSHFNQHNTQHDKERGDKSEGTVGLTQDVDP